MAFKYAKEFHPLEYMLSSKWCQVRLSLLFTSQHSLHSQQFSFQSSIIYTSTLSQASVLIRALSLFIWYFFCSIPVSHLFRVPFMERGPPGLLFIYISKNLLINLLMRQELAKRLSYPCQVQPCSSPASAAKVPGFLYWLTTFRLRLESWGRMAPVFIGNRLSGAC